VYVLASGGWVKEAATKRKVAFLVSWRGRNPKNVCRPEVSNFRLAFERSGVQVKSYPQPP